MSVVLHSQKPRSLPFACPHSVAQVWRKMETNLRENVSEEAKESADAAVADAINRLEIRLAEVRQMPNEE